MFLEVVADDNEVLEDATLTRSFFCCVVFRFRSLLIFEISWKLLGGRERRKNQKGQI